MRPIPYLFLPLLLLLWGGCELEKTNINPNDPSDVPLSTLLPPAQQAVANSQAGDGALIASIFSNYFTGFDALVQPLERYVVDNDFFMRPVWSDLYATAMPTLQLIIEKGDAQNAPHYAGVGRVLQALCLGSATSLWGDVPYSEAFLGAEQLTPRYDAQEAIYAEIQALLDRAISDLQANTSVFSPGDDDLFFGGERQKWLRAAHSLKARYWMHSIKRRPDAPQQALAALANGLADNADNLAYPANSLEFNPWYRYMQSTPNIRVDASFAALVDDDPREDYYIRRVFGERFIGTYYAGQFEALPLLTRSEHLFLEAEALLRTGGSGAEAALQAAISAHMAQVSGGAIEPATVDAYIAAHAVLSGNLEADLATLMLEKHKAMFMSMEGWTDYRRTGLPALQPNADGQNPQNPNGAIPRRFPYPLNELLYNPNVPDPQPDLQTRFWWDE